MIVSATVTAADVLRGVRELLDDPQHWTKEQNARCASGLAVEPWHPEAKCWCLYGAYAKVCHDVGLTVHDSVYWEAFRALRTALPPRRNLQQWNDAKKRTHVEVVNLIGLAMELAA